MKCCSRCRQDLPLNAFSKTGGNVAWKRSWCRECVSAYDKSRITPERTELRRKQQLTIRDRNMTFLCRYLMAHPCVDCGEDDPFVLEFDHVRDDKEFNVSEAVARNMSLRRIEGEIGKCVVRCANCHRRKTAKTIWTRKVRCLEQLALAPAKSE